MFISNITLYLFKCSCLFAIICRSAADGVPNTSLEGVTGIELLRKLEQIFGLQLKSSFYDRNDLFFKSLIGTFDIFVDELVHRGSCVAQSFK